MGVIYTAICNYYMKKVLSENIILLIKKNIVVL